MSWSDPVTVGLYGAGCFFVGWILAARNCRRLWVRRLREMSGLFRQSGSEVRRRFSASYGDDAMTGAASAFETCADILEGQTRPDSPRARMRAAGRG